MSIKEAIGKLFGLIPDEVHNSQLKELRDSLQFLVSNREQQVIDLQHQVHNLQNDLKTCKTNNTELDGLRQTIQTLTAKIQSMKQEAPLSPPIVEESTHGISEENAVNLISFISYLDLLKVSDDLSLNEGLQLLKSKYEDTLNTCGLSIVKEYTGVFNALCQKVVGNEATSDSKLINHVAKVVNPGYFIDNKCIQPIEVIVYTLSEL